MGKEAFLLARWLLLKSKPSSRFINQKASLFAISVAAKSGYLTNCIGFIDGTVLKIARPTDYGLKTYSGHKRARAQTFQALTTPHGMFLHSFGPLEDIGMTGLYMPALNSSISWNNACCLTAYGTVYMETVDTNGGINCKYCSMGAF